MTPLRQQMIDAMRQRGYSIRTHQTYLNAVSALARYFKQSPEQLNKHRMMLLTCYGWGLRVSELVGIRVRDIDGKLGMTAVLHTWGQTLS